MRQKGSILSLFILFFLISASVSLYAQAVPGSLMRGIELYGQGKWQEAVTELRRASAETQQREHTAEALYWIALAELAAGEYEAAVTDLEELMATNPEGLRAAEAPYHKGRALYMLGRFDPALILFKAFSDAVPDKSMKAAALYWMGECLFSLGRLDDARVAFTSVTELFPESAKYEAASYRLALIDQKKIEGELLKLLKWSHEESLKTVEEYQRRERSYEQAIVAYQKRIAEMLKDTRLADLEKSNSEYQTKLAEANERIVALEQSLAEEQAKIAELQEGLSIEATASSLADKESESFIPPYTDSERVQRLLMIKNSALELKNILLNRLAVLESEQSAAQGAGK